MYRGLFGRQPDHVSLFYLGMLDIRRDFSQGNADCERNIETYWRYVRDNDLALSHGFVDPQVDPSTPPERSPLIHVVGRNQEGVIVRGVKSTATFATHADEVFVGSLPRPGLSLQQIVYFAVPIATPGLRVVARTDLSVGSAFDHPVSAYGDENDCMLVFDDVPGAVGARVQPGGRHQLLHDRLSADYRVGALEHPAHAWP